MTRPKPTEIVKKYAPWSVSKANISKQCPHRFYLQYVKKVKVDVPPTQEALVGIAAHSALEYAIGSNGKLSVARCFKLAITEHSLTTREIEIVRGFQPAVENFMQKLKIYRHRHNADLPIIEQKLAVDFEGNPIKFWDNSGLIRGVVDMSLRFKGRPHALIIDHKTGKERELAYFEKQFDTYALLMRAAIPELEAIKLGINFIKADRIDFKKGMLDVRDVQALLNKVLSFLNETTREADNHKLVRPGPLCNWCDYKSVCPAHADGTDGKKQR